MYVELDWNLWIRKVLQGQLMQNSQFFGNFGKVLNFLVPPLVTELCTNFDD